MKICCDIPNGLITSVLLFELQYLRIIVVVAAAAAVELGCYPEVGWKFVIVILPLKLQAVFIWGCNMSTLLCSL
jgi:hypothetical protein